MALAIAVSFMPTSAFAASKVKMTGYDQVYMTGNTAYCAGTKGIYKVTLSNGAVTSKKLIFKAERYALATLGILPITVVTE